MFVATTRVVDAPSSWLEVIASSIRELTMNRSRVSGLVTCSAIPTQPLAWLSIRCRACRHLIREHVDEWPATSIPERELAVLAVAGELDPEPPLLMSQPFRGLSPTELVPVLVAASDGRTEWLFQHSQELLAVLGEQLVKRLWGERLLHDSTFRCSNVSISIPLMIISQDLSLCINSRPYDEF